MSRVRVMVFNATFNNISVTYIVAVSFIGGGNWRIRKTTTDLSQVTDKLYHIVLYQVKMGFKYCTSEYSWTKFYLIEHFDLVYRIMFAKQFKATILRLEIFLILETN
jgi:hypothetical protein